VCCVRVRPIFTAVLLSSAGLCAALGYCVTRSVEQIDGIRIESIADVAETPALFGTRPGYPGYGRYLQLEFSAPARLAEAIEQSDGFYPKVGFCPLTKESKVLALGPHLPDGRDMPLGDVAMPLDSQNRLRYRLFVVPAHPMPGVKYAAGFDQQPYDLASDQRPLCMKLESTGFKFERVQTNTIEIPASVLAKALSAPAGTR
jgi:hypothetical protein